MLANGLIEPEKLPPSERSAYHHGLRVHIQIMQWLLLDEDDKTFIPTEWGWVRTDNHLRPIPTNKVIAVRSLIQGVSRGNTVHAMTSKHVKSCLKAKRP